MRLRDLPRELHDRTGTRSLIVFDEVQDILAVTGADGQIRSVIQHHAEAASYAFSGSAPGMMERLFADPRRPLFEQAVSKSLAPLPNDAIADYVAGRFEQTGRDAGDALSALLELCRGHPQRSMLLAHHLWAATPPGATADGRWSIVPTSSRGVTASSSPIRCWSSGSSAGARSDPGPGGTTADG